VVHSVYVVSSSRRRSCKLREKRVSKCHVWCAILFFTCFSFIVCAVSPVRSWLIRAGCGYPHLQSGCGNPHCHACGCGAGVGCTWCECGANKHSSVHLATVSCKCTIPWSVADRWCTVWDKCLCPNGCGALLKWRPSDENAPLLAPI